MVGQRKEETSPRQALRDREAPGPPGSFLNAAGRSFRSAALRNKTIETSAIAVLQVL